MQTTLSTTEEFTASGDFSDPFEIPLGGSAETVTEMKIKLREVLTHAHTLQTFCQLSVEETQKRVDYASRLLVDPPHDLLVLSKFSPLLSLSETILTEVSVRVLRVLNNLENLNNSHPELRARDVEIGGSAVLEPAEDKKTGGDENIESEEKDVTEIGIF